ncbi:MAG: cupin domain-containing protein [Euzebyales bacterium]|nr:cupin domain-containing protein [Euzebyales bacterium]
MTETHSNEDRVVQLDELAPTDCSCGTTRRGFADREHTPATVHLLEVTEEARTHYHQRLTELYIVLEGEGHLEVDGDPVPLRPMTTVLVEPGVRHRAVGKLRVLNVVLPRFDPHDEWFD